MKSFGIRIRIEVADLAEHQIDDQVSYEARYRGPDIRREVSGSVFTNVCWPIQQQVKTWNR